MTLGELTNGDIAVEAITTTELSGFGLQLDMSDTLAIAVSQSGTTTDTNRTVDLLKARRGAGDRQSSLKRPHRQGRRGDVRPTEATSKMSVASTKAFYAQIAAGTLLTLRDQPSRRVRLGAKNGTATSCSPRWICPRRPRAAGAAGDRRGGTLRRRSGTGQWSATVPARSLPKAADQAQRAATSRSPATSPGTRSTSTCRRSR